MNEDFHSQAWVDNRASLSTGVSDVARLIRVAFERLAALQYAAPWTEVPERRAARCDVARPQVDAATSASARCR